MIYYNWVRNAVSPRDMLIHRNDFKTRYQYTIDGRTIPIHREIYLFSEQKMGAEDYNEPLEYYYKYIVSTVNHLYEFLFKLFSSLSEKDIILRKFHFSNISTYNAYIAGL